MAPQELERTVQRSVLDRLIDTDPDNASEPALTWAQSVRELKHAVRRDLEWLLNTRRIVTPAPEGWAELPRSLYHYGLPDITSLAAASVSARDFEHRVEHDLLRARFHQQQSVDGEAQLSGAAWLRGCYGHPNLG